MPGAFYELNMTPNELYRKVGELRESGRFFVDLTCSNFTKHGEPFPVNVLGGAVGTYLKDRSYEPDAKGCRRAREVIASLYEHRGLRVAAEQIFLTASSSESYRLLFSLLCDVGDTVLSPAITYPLFDILAEDQRVRLEHYMLHVTGEPRRWGVDERGLRSLVHGRCRAILSISPHNPTGMTITDRTHPFGAMGLPLISDEVFSRYAWPEECDGFSISPPLGALFPELPVFHLDGLSKAYCLPDFKVSWIAMNGPGYELLGERLALLNDSYLSGSPITQAVVSTLLDPEVVRFQTRVRARIRRNIELGIAAFARWGDVVSPQGGTQLFVPIAGLDDEDRLTLELLEAGVLVHPSHFYHASDFYSADDQGGGIVISCVPEEALFSEGLARIAQTLEGRFGNGRDRAEFTTKTIDKSNV